MARRARPDETARLAWARETLGHDFSDAGLLAEALRHSSLPGRNYQRLEFLGDRILGSVMASWLYSKFPLASEGDLAKRFADMVCAGACAQVAQSIDVSRWVEVAPGAAQTGVQHAESVLADCCEALIAALYLDGGMAAAERFIRQCWSDKVDTVMSAPGHPKSRLQEWAQGRGLAIPAYRLVGREGPDHAPSFQVAVSVGTFDPVLASGPTKQEAEKSAAQLFLETYQNG